MWTVVAYSKVLSQTSELVYLDPIFDDHVRIEPPNIIVPDDLTFLAGVFVERELPFSMYDRAQVESPSLRRILLRDVEFQRAIGSVEIIQSWPKMFYNPIPLEPREPLRVRATQFGTGTRRVNAFIFLSDGAQSEVGGEIYTVLCACEGTVTAHTWSTLKLNITQVLPSGRYQVVGARVQHTSSGAFRLVFVGQAWRPGGLIVNFINVQDDLVFRRGALGVWGEFTHDQPPAVQIFTNVSGGDVYVYLDIIKIE